MNTLELSNIDWSAFHFIRPQALWLIPVFFVICALIWYSNREEGKWKKLIARHLRPFLFTKSSSSSIWLPLISFLFAGILGALSLAGPTWKMVERPGVETSANMVILLDASWSMMVEDVQPNRLERAKLKINDLIDANPGSGLSLYVYAGTTHAVMPNTSDYSLIRKNTEYLTSGMMPVLGSDLSEALVVMDSVFNRFDAPSTLLLITDEISEIDQPALESFISTSAHRVELLTMATFEGGIVPGFSPNTVLKDEEGNALVSLPNQNVIAALGVNDRFFNNQLTLDKSDVEGIAERMRQNLVFQLEGEEVENEWMDAGPFLLIPLALLMLLFFRKGYMIYWCLFIGCFIMACSPDSKYAHLWYSNDYRGQLLEADSLYFDAAEAYDDLQRKAIAYFKAGDFEASASLFEQDSSEIGKYNYGLALTGMGRYDEAQEVFEGLHDSQKENLPVDQMLQMIRDERSLSDSINRFDPTEVLEQKKDESPLNERRASGKDEELTSDTETDELPQSGDRVTDEVETEMRKAEELERPPEDMEMGKNVDASNIMLRAISADPSEFLRRRFKLQQEKYYPGIKPKQRH